MNKDQWKNLWHSYRWMKRRATWHETVVWIGSYSLADGWLIYGLTKEVGHE